jgi:hypothetical protein
MAAPSPHGARQNARGAASVALVAHGAERRTEAGESLQQLAPTFREEPEAYSR